MPVDHLQGLVELAVNRNEPVIESTLVQLLLKLLQDVLAHGLLPHARTAPHTWTSMLGQHPATPFDMLLVRQVLCCV